MTQHPPHTTPPPAYDRCGDQLNLTGPYAVGRYRCGLPAGHVGRHEDSQAATTWPDLMPRGDPAQLATEAVTAELEAIHAGLDPEQEIRARAAAIVGCPAMAGLPDSDNHRAAWLEEAGFVAAYIRDGSRP